MMQTGENGSMQTKYTHQFLWIYMAVMAVVSIYIYGIILKANGDNVEHLHTSWMIWMGNIPYKDFFQHHNPLMWYLSAPLVASLIYNPNIFSVFNIIGIGALYIIAYYQSKLFFLKEKNYSAALFLAAILVSAYSLLWSTDYRPDTFMFMCYYMGMYYLFLYIENGRCKTLVICFLCFLISFLFTQKVLMHLIIPGCAVIYWLCTGKMKFMHIIYASIAPLILLLLFLGYFYYHDALGVYWRSNYYFNTYIPKIFEQQRIIIPPREYIDFYIFIPIGAVASIYLLYKGTAFERIFSLMFIVETAFRLLYFSAFLHYVIFWLMTAIMLSVIFLTKPLKYNKIFLSIYLIYLIVAACSIIFYGHHNNLSKYITIGCLALGITTLLIFILYKADFNIFLGGLTIAYLFFMGYYNYLLTYKTEIKSYHTVSGHDLSFKVLTPCDYALNGYYATYNLRAKDPGYYTILLGQIDVLGEKAGIRKKDDLNELIREKKPKIISAGIYWNTYWEQRGKKIPAHKIDDYLLNTYYEPTGVGDLFILKPQYQKHNCVYNGKEWRFMD